MLAAASGGLRCLAPARGATFFQPQAYLAQHHPQRGPTHPQMFLRCQSCLQLGQGAIRLLPQPATQLLAYRLGELGLASGMMRNPFHLPRAPLLTTNFLDIAQTDSEALG